MKKFLCLLCCVFTLALTACSSSYERNEEPGELVNITVDEMQDKIDNKESFAIVFTKTTCDYCIKFHTMLDSYLLYHGIVLYEVVLDEAPQSEQKGNLKQINKTFDLDSTPTLYYVKDGKVDDKIVGGIEEDAFDDWVVKHKLDEKN